MSQRCPVYAKSLYKVDPELSDDFIRLVRPSGHFNGWFWYELKTFALGNAPPYAALSYSWGTKPRTTALIIFNGTTMDSLDVTEDLEDALTNIRVEHAADLSEYLNWSGWLWVDQICINQADDLEKGHQVHNMKDIYRNARCVFIWLGKEMIDDDHGLDYERKAKYGLFDRKIIDLLQQGLHCWWNRLWVVQEISICKHLLVWIGARAFEWNDWVRDFLDHKPKFKDWLPKGRLLTPMDYRKAIFDAKEQLIDRKALRISLRSRKNGDDLLKLLRSTSPSGVSNELDRVFALLGLATDDYRENIPITYGVSKSLVFSSVVQHAIARSEKLDVLFDQWPRGPGMHDRRPQSATNVEAGRPRSTTAAMLPTWLPDFSQATGNEFTTVTRSKHEAGTFEKPNVTVVGIELCLIAVVFDTVESTREILNIEFHQFQRAFEIDMQSSMGLHVLNSVRAPNCPVFWREFSNCPLTRRVFFTTKQGYFGFASAVEVGDEIIVPFGASAPFVVRFTSTENDEQRKEPPRREHPSFVSLTTSKVHPKSATRDVCELVGDCYVSGIMSGQIKDLLDRGEVQTKEYRIS